MKYEIHGETLPAVVCELEKGEAMITEKGAMAWMSPNMQMETNAGGIGKAFGRLFSGESMFRNTYTAKGGPGMIAFASSFPGSIRAFEVGPGQESTFTRSWGQVCSAVKALLCRNSREEASCSLNSTATLWSMIWKPASRW